MLKENFVIFQPAFEGLKFHKIREFYENYSSMEFGAGIFLPKMDRPAIDVTCTNNNMTMRK